MSVEDKILLFIKGYIEESGYPPTIREIKEGVGISSTSMVASYLKKLERDKKITRSPFVARGIVVQ